MAVAKYLTHKMVIDAAVKAGYHGVCFGKGYVNGVLMPQITAECFGRSVVLAVADTMMQAKKELIAYLEKEGSVSVAINAEHGSADSHVVCFREYGNPCVTCGVAVENDASLLCERCLAAEQAAYATDTAVMAILESLSPLAQSPLAEDTNSTVLDAPTSVDLALHSVLTPATTGKALLYRTARVATDTLPGFPQGTYVALLGYVPSLDAYDIADSLDPLRQRLGCALRSELADYCL